MPLLKVDHSGKHLRAKYDSIEAKKPISKEEIHAFDGNHISMPIAFANGSLINQISDNQRIWWICRL